MDVSVLSGSSYREKYVPQLTMFEWIKSKCPSLLDEYKTHGILLCEAKTRVWILRTPVSREMGMKNEKINILVLSLYIQKRSTLLH